MNAKDSLHAFEPNGCKSRQTIIRRAVFDGNKRFAVNKALWDALSARDQAGMIMHEVIYEHFSKLGEEDSRKARKLNALLFSPELDEMNEGKFWLFVKKLEVPLYP